MRVAAFLILLGVLAPGQSASFSPALYGALRWRLVGPYRAGRVTAVSGTAADPNLYYIGTPGGGVWKTTDGGVVWKPVFDGVAVASIGALAAAPSNPEVVYAATGEQMPGHGMYVSRDGGEHWRQAGLEQAATLDAVVVDPRDADLALAAAATGGQRGVYRTTDGGGTWTQTLAPEEDGGAVALCFDPGNARIVYAATQTGRDGAIYRSSDEGATWTKLEAAGLPLTGAGKIGLAVAPQTGGERVYAYLTQGLFRSDDGGASWRRATEDPRITGGGYFSQVYVDPNHPNVVYAVETAFYRSADGGRTFTVLKGAPGGDDYHVLWIDPADSRRMILGVDQGATITVDGGATWSVWFNQPTAQLYRVSTDRRFPFSMYSSQQDSGGTLALPDRSDYGRISIQDWYSTGGNENAYSAPDPTNPNLVYVNGWYNNVVRFDRRTGQVFSVFVAGNEYRLAHPAPLEFSPSEPRRLYLGTQYLLASDDGGDHWQRLGGDLTAGGPAAARAGGRGRRSGGAAITAIAPSASANGLIWVGTSNGLVQVSRDGGLHWHKVLEGPGPVSMIEASLQAAGRAFVVAERTGGRVWRTEDYGATWRAADAGLPAGPVHAVREDGVKAGLCFAGTDAGVFVSFDAGAEWQPLQLNLPASSVRDLAVVGDDLAAATYGRGMWVLDDIGPLRQLGAAQAAMVAGRPYLYAPGTVTRVHNDNDQDMPLPPEDPAGANPPGPAVFDYVLPQGFAGTVRLGIYDAAGKLVREFTSAPPAPRRALYAVQEDWLAPPKQLPAQAGHNRFAWDLRTAPPAVLQPRGFISYEVGDDAVPGGTPPQEPEGYLIAPGRYEVRLEADGTELRQTMRVAMDPRVRATAASVSEQVGLEGRVAGLMALSARGYGAAQAAGARAGSAARAFAQANRELTSYFSAISSGDGAPNGEIRGLFAGYCGGLAQAVASWNRAEPAQALPAPECGSR